MIKLVIAIIKQVFRDKQTIFWSLIFPALFMVVFGLFNFSYTLNSNIIIIDKVNNTITQQLIKQLSIIDGIKINKDIDSEEIAKKYIIESKKIYFDSNYKAKPDILLAIENIDNNQLDIKLYSKEDKNQQIDQASIISSILKDISYKNLLYKLQINEPIKITEEALETKKINYLDILLPGILAMGIMQSAMFGISAEISSLKERKILKRLKATPLPTWKFLFAEITARQILTIIQITFILLISIFFLKVNIYGNIILIYIMSLLGSLIFINFGFIIASITKNPRASAGLSQAISTPMMFLSGVFFERTMLPKIIKIISDYLPLSPLIDTLRKISIESANILDIKFELFILFTWFLISMFVAIKLNIFKNEI